MIVRTRIFELCRGKYKSLSELAQAMGISVSQVYRVRESKRNINQKFVVGAIKAFPEHNLDDLFYLVPRPLTIANNHRHQDSAMHSTDKPVVEERQRVESTRQAVESVASAIDEYA